MHVVLVGAGGREHALAWRIARSPSLTRLTVLADNPGWPAIAVRGSGDVLTEAAQADLVVIGPEAPLEAGLADEVSSLGVPCFGPIRAAARLESSKAFAKEVMAATGVPTARCQVFTRDQEDEARAYVAEGRVVVKADGLAAGKGVIVCPTGPQAQAALGVMWGEGRFGAAADRLVIEELLTGPEVSVFGLSDGTRVVGLPSAQDHKRLRDGDAGPNTGGMGAYAPCPLVDADGVEAILDRVHRPVVAELARRGTPFRGVLYAGMMLTSDGPRVIEFNARFGDPECQPLMTLWDDDVLPWLHGAATGSLPAGGPRFRSGAACCVVLASAGYPATSTKGVAIPEPEEEPGVEVFFAAARRDEAGVLRTAGGRVLGITGVGPDLRTARDRAYVAASGWMFEGAQVRRDIGASALV